ncbi:MAG: LacI family DNA-binding transcriptional regulator [Blautia sp.]|nr:LacI family DNA-binding transcriptional regulator [Blautia sp.]
MNITIADVAREAHVSKSTVSNYMNGRYEKMSYETRQQIEKTIRSMGYVPNLSARRLSNKRKSRTLCLIIPGNLTRVYDSLYYPTVFHAAEKIAAGENYKMLIYSRGSTVAEDEIHFLKELASSIVDGFLIFDLDPKDRFFLEFEEADIPYICAGQIENFTDYNFVASDHEKAMYDSLKYLTQIGHKRIGIFAPTTASVVEEARRHSIDEFCRNESFDRSAIVEFHVSDRVTETEVLNIWRSVLRDEKSPCAFIVSNAIRTSLLIAAQELNLQIPRDISYVNIEYYRKGALVNQEQTRVESRADEIVSIMFRELLKQIYEPDKTKRPNIIIPLSLVIGETTAPPG